MSDLHVIVPGTLDNEPLHVVMRRKLRQGQQSLHAHRLINLINKRNLINMKINLASIQQQHISIFSLWWKKTGLTILFLSDLSHLLEQPHKGHVSQRLRILHQGPGLLTLHQLLEAGVHLAAES